MYRLSDVIMPISTGLFCCQDSLIFQGEYSIISMELLGKQEDTNQHQGQPKIERNRLSGTVVVSSDDVVVGPAAPSLSFDSSSTENTSIGRSIGQKRISQEDVIIESMVSTHLMEVYHATAEASNMDGEMFQEGLSLTSVVSERELHELKVPEQVQQNAKPVRATKEEGVTFQKGSRVGQDGAPKTLTTQKSATIELSDGSYRVDSNLKGQSPKCCQFRLRNGDRSAEAVFITFGLYALERSFQILSTTPNETCIRLIKQPNKLTKLFSLCCLTSKTTQLFQLVQNRGQTQQVMINLVEGSQDQFDAFTSGLRQKLWDINEITYPCNQLSLTDAENLEMFLCSHRRTTIKELREQLSDQQGKRRGSFLTEVCLERVIETSDVLIDTYAVRNPSPSSADNAAIAKFVFREARITEMFAKLFVQNENLLNQKRKRLSKEYNDQQLLKAMQADPRLQLMDSGKLAEAGEDKPYGRAILQLNRLVGDDLPAEQLQCLNKYFTLLGECYRSYHQQDMPAELSNHLLPVHSFCLVRTTSSAGLYSLLKLLEQFVKRSDRLESGMTVVSSLCLAAEYLCSWKI